MKKRIPGGAYRDGHGGDIGGAGGEVAGAGKHGLEGRRTGRGKKKEREGDLLGYLLLFFFFLQFFFFWSFFFNNLFGFISYCCWTFFGAGLLTFLVLLLDYAACRSNFFHIY